MQERIDDILKYWFGNVERTVLPSEKRTNIWFAGEPAIDTEIAAQFSKDLDRAISGEYSTWEGTARGSLALIILLDQFSRNIYRDTPKAFSADQKALDLCMTGIRKQFDHDLSLIERVFFYIPLMHSEVLEMQATSVRAYKTLVDLSFAETQSLFEQFLTYAIKHYEVIKRFGRFPQRNHILSRTNTDEETVFLEQLKNKS